jgi:hypothetical protein
VYREIAYLLEPRFGILNLDFGYEISIGIISSTSPKFRDGPLLPVPALSRVPIHVDEYYGATMICEATTAVAEVRR